MHRLDYDRKHCLVTLDEGLGRTFLEVETVLAHGRLPILIEGPTGTGKEGVALALHWHGPRRQRPFLPVNCASLDPNLADSLLFGHVRGAFTGAIAESNGHFRSAAGGTVFLDEIDKLPMAAQGKLLRFLQDGFVMPVGSSKPVHVDVRVVAASKENIRRMVEAGEFREDLYFRLETDRVSLPPLSARPCDVLFLARRFAAAESESLSIRIRDLTVPAARRLVEWPWPGNVRELENAIGSAVLRHRLLTPGKPLLDLSDLPAKFTSGLAGRCVAPDEEGAVVGSAGLIDPILEQRPVPYDTKGTRSLILGVLASLGDATVGEVARAVGREKTAVRRELQRMQRDALVALVPRKGRRGTLVRLTPPSGAVAPADTGRADR